MHLPISSMSTAEKLDAMEQLWLSLQAEGGDVVPPDWHQEVLAERQKRIDKGETSFSSLNDVRKRLDRRDS
ncbi:MAG: addiction module protein [Planctomycetaceae bacterium]|nr:addiction module protein [Planctomycetaceae bacterium]MCB9954005.1 addiction module protein [Planctomycetaceae bacterium]